MTILVVFINPTANLTREPSESVSSDLTETWTGGKNVSENHTSKFSAAEINFGAVD